MADDNEEKRRYFRVNDTINLLHKVIDEDDVDKLSHVTNDVLGNCTLPVALEVLNEEARMLAPRLERRDPEFFDYLKILDTKINLIAKAMTVRDDEFSKHDKREVSLSGAGLAFTNPEPIEVGTLLELRMLLTSCLAVIVAFARVVQCKAIADNPSETGYEICVEYINMKDEDRELLVKHVVKKQLQQLRDKNGG